MKIEKIKERKYIHTLTHILAVIIYISVWMSCGQLMGHTHDKIELHIISSIPGGPDMTQRPDMTQPCLR